MCSVIYIVSLLCAGWDSQFAGICPSGSRLGSVWQQSQFLSIFFWDRVLSSDWPWTSDTAKDDLEFLPLLPVSPKSSAQIVGMCYHIYYTTQGLVYARANTLLTNQGLQFCLLIWICAIWIEASLAICPRLASVFRLIWKKCKYRLVQQNKPCCT